MRRGTVWDTDEPGEAKVDQRQSADHSRLNLPADQAGPARCSIAPATGNRPIFIDHLLQPGIDAAIGRLYPGRQSRWLGGGPLFIGLYSHVSHLSFRPGDSIETWPVESSIGVYSTPS